MLTILKKLDDIDFRQLMDVYAETVAENGRAQYAKLYENLQLIYAEQDFYAYLEIFFSDKNARYAMWSVAGVYKAALRLESYDDGLLLTALETAPESRKRGYASALVKSVLEYLKTNGEGKLYSHVAKVNDQSLSIHRQCGFYEVLDHAIFLDGSVHNDYFTFCYKY